MEGVTDGVGPIYAAGFQDITQEGYSILYLADLNNDALQREGKAPIYYWLPNGVRLARKQEDTGDFKFSFTHFVGKRGSVDDVSGGLLGFSTTVKPPAKVLQQSQDALLDRFRGNDDKYWGWRTSVAPMFRPAPIMSNTTTVTNLSPNPDGTVPHLSKSGSQNGAGGAVAQRRSRAMQSRPPAIVSIAPPFVMRDSPPTMSIHQALGRPGLDQWYYNLQGQGAGSVNPFAENAYSGLVGSLPAALIWNSFHQGSGGISIWQNMRIKVWSPAVEIIIDGEWDAIQDHLSAAAAIGNFWWSASIQAEFNEMRKSGLITTQIKVDTTLPNADKLEERLEKRADLVFQKFMDEAEKTIFEPVPFTEKPAEAQAHSGVQGFLGLGGGGQYKLRKDQTHIALHFQETREFAYLQEYPISGQLEGLYDEIKADPTAEKKYFNTVYLGDWERILNRVVKPVVNWPRPGEGWVGEPVAFLSAQIGYPDKQGIVQWDGHVFQPSDGADVTWNVGTEMKAAGDVSNAPAGWTPDKTFLKRAVHFLEPPNDSEYPFARVQIEKNVVDLDPGELGSLVNEINLEVRVDNVGALSVGPIVLNVDLENTKQNVEVLFQAEGKTAEGVDRPPVKFKWSYDDQNQPRFWMVFTGQPDFVPRFTYRVRVYVKGTIFGGGMEWLGPVEHASASGPLFVTVPTSDAPRRVQGSSPPVVSTKRSSLSRRLGGGRGDGESESSEVLGWPMQAPPTSSMDKSEGHAASPSRENGHDVGSRDGDMFLNFLPTSRA